MTSQNQVNISHDKQLLLNNDSPPPSEEIYKAVNILDVKNEETKVIADQFVYSLQGKVQLGFILRCISKCEEMCRALGSTGESCARPIPYEPLERRRIQLQSPDAKESSTTMYLEELESQLIILRQIAETLASSLPLYTHHTVDHQCQSMEHPHPDEDTASCEESVEDTLLATGASTLHKSSQVDIHLSTIVEV